MMKKTHQVPTWSALTQAVGRQFGPTQYENPRAQLFKLTQTGLVQEYHIRFMVIANRVEGLSTEALLDCFISGLRDDLHCEVTSREPESLPKATALARLLDEKTTTTWGYLKGRSPTTFTTIVTTPRGLTSTSGLGSTSTAKANLPPLLPKPNTKPLMPAKKLTPAEIQLKREKGLCYMRDEKFSATHWCPNRQIMMLHYETDDNPIEDQIEDKREEQNPENTGPVELHHLSLNALHGTSGKCTIRFIENILGIDVLVLLDGGRSDDFIQPRIVKHLNLPVERVPPFRVMVGNNQYMQGDSIVKDLPLMIQGTRIHVSAFVLPSTSYDVVLGSSWLATLGSHISNYNEAFIKFLTKDR
ncbi:uncharacterized protein LOC129315609 [Prosopis cineraria]|uniref:uncharacterized protein LOC129315609 n=1 Tax=Prosopis cineraria TaxID=364024 RepID=UPI00240FBBE9|nr:uncharacterized protein LOC129315609 [Prosopis cineraria]XP_054815423.1 uncharacterized protein LOC129315609 [Prosopis cineraria]XP_054815424.1 uncharacterized protein LOC129315609 [Prosopis cineraria]XP_054815425.1 uncharacterized protein LOC129315609 [Prosopis cineraria]XP_054815426.1 uncharacterized protein LOC129315609 [Prosopis cineraria]XP_054815428.1 uncharacterized protein LOC129315609 [Prosopis cineraria]XP_054815429.1 uncharacterized protein LOC129315609 [Prosopis cineraria]XP_0